MERIANASIRLGTCWKSPASRRTSVNQRRRSKFNPTLNRAYNLRRIEVRPHIQSVFAISTPHPLQFLIEPNLGFSEWWSVCAAGYSQFSWVRFTVMACQFRSHTSFNLHDFISYIGFGRCGMQDLADIVGVEFQWEGESSRGYEPEVQQMLADNNQPGPLCCRFSIGRGLRRRPVHGDSGRNRPWVGVAAWSGSRPSVASCWMCKPNVILKITNWCICLQ